MEIYVIKGKTGFYEDEREWMVKAFRVKSEAKKYKKELIRFWEDHKHLKKPPEEDLFLDKHLYQDWDEAANFCKYVMYDIDVVELA